MRGKMPLDHIQESLNARTSLKNLNHLLHAESSLSPARTSFPDGGHDRLFHCSSPLKNWSTRRNQDEDWSHPRLPGSVGTRVWKLDWLVSDLHHAQNSRHRYRVR